MSPSISKARFALHLLTFLKFFSFRLHAKTVCQKGKRGKCRYALFVSQIARGVRGPADEGCVVVSNLCEEVESSSSNVRAKYHTG